MRQAREGKEGAAAKPTGPAREAITGALDPATRAELLELLGDALWGVLGEALARVAAKVAVDGSGAPAATAPAPRETAGPERPAAEPAQRRDRRYPYPHGDVDLGSLPANVPTAEARRPRRSASRRFYFLPDSPDGEVESGESRKPQRKG